MVGGMLAPTGDLRTGRILAPVRGTAGRFFEEASALELASAPADDMPSRRVTWQDHPDATVELRDGTRPVRGRAAAGDERARLWAMWHGIDGFAPMRSRETAIVVLEPHVDPR